METLGRWNARIYAWLVPVLGVFALTGTTLFSLHWGFGVTGIVMAAAAALSQIVQNRWSDRQAEIRRQEEEHVAREAYNAAVDRHAILADQLDPIARTIAEMPDQNPADREATFRRVVTQAVNSIMVAIPDVRGLRAVVYEVAADGHRMQVVDWTARTHRTAPNPFSRGNTRGDAAFSLLMSGEALFVGDIAAGFRGRERVAPSCARTRRLSSAGGTP